MDNGQIFKQTFRVDPGENGSFIVRMDYDGRADRMPRFWAFSTVDELIRWLAKNVEGFKLDGPQAGEGKP